MPSREKNSKSFSYKKRRLAGRLVVHILLILGAVIFLLPLLWMISTSLKPLEETVLIPPTWIPSEILWSNYAKATTAIPFWMYARNTLIVCILSIIGTLSSSILVAYGFSRLQWRGRDIMFWLVLGTMMIPFPVVMVPLFVVFSKLGWIGTLKPLWVPTFAAGAFNVFLLRQFFRTIPMELSEAARIDGCSEFGILFRIILPLSKPVLLVVALFQFIYSWNDFMGPLLYLTKDHTFTLALGLQMFQNQQGGTQWNLLMAASTLVILPIILLFFLTQRSFIEGISLTGSKG